MRRCGALLIGVVAGVAAVVSGYNAFIQPFPVSAIALVFTGIFWAIVVPFLLYGIIGQALWRRWGRRS